MRRIHPIHLGFGLAVAGVIVVAHSVLAAPTPTLPGGPGGPRPQTPVTPRLTLPPNLQPVKSLTFTPKSTIGTTPTLVRSFDPKCPADDDCFLVARNVGRHQLGPTPAGVTLDVEPETPGAKKPAVTVTAWTDVLIGFTLAPAAPGKYRVTVRGEKVSSNTIEITMIPGNASHDADGDQVIAAKYGGADCDDHDPRRHPGAPEAADSADVDEDCNPDSVGTHDLDGDGQTDMNACNAVVVGTGLDRTLSYVCGNDCDDSNFAIGPGAMICDPRDTSVIFVCRVAGARTVSATGFDPRWSVEHGLFDPYHCNDWVPGSHCVVEPNHTGICR